VAAKAVRHPPFHLGDLAVEAAMITVRELTVAA